MKKQGLTRQAALIGSNWNNGLNAGTFNWNLNNAASNVNLNNTASNVNRNIGTRTIFVRFWGLVEPCLLAKHRNIKTCAGRGLLAFERSVIPQRPMGALP